MPNWCNNTLELAHEDPSMVARAEKAFNEGRLLDEFVPIPAELKITAGRLGDPVEQAALEAQEAANLAKYGYKTWYDFCVNEWGTKWDIGGDDCNPAQALGTQFGHGIIVNFDSAWSPPIGAYDKLLELGFSVRAYYYEPGMAFVGKWDNGDDEFYEYGGETSETVRDAIGDELDEMFGISESMEEYEAENEEDEELYTWVKDGAEKKETNE